ncbi:MAG: hypothetical protein H0Z32_08220 [Bacillaceae bacterium]|nr:hypothetical protein [Bacillaceae bacterium]
MNVRVYFDNHFIGTIPYSTIAWLRGYCRKNGYKTSWDPQEQKLQVHTAASEREVQIFLDKEARQHKHSHDIIGKIQSLLKGGGIAVGDCTEERITGTDLNIQISVKEKEVLESPFVDIICSIPPLKVKFGNALKSVNPSSFDYFIHLGEDQGQIQSILQLECQLPRWLNDKEKEEKMDQMAMELAEAILSFIHDDLPESSYLFEGMMLFQSASSVHSYPENHTDHSHDQRRIQASTIQAEVIFDYQVKVLLDRKQVLVDGNFVIKNSGNQTLNKPVICLKAHPAELIRLRAPILPPDLIETYGTQSGEGPVGWQYVDKDWQTNVQEKGEYWVTPIHQTHIPPNERLLLPNVRLIISQNEERTPAIVQGIVFFPDVHKRFQSSNQIRISW